jgi:hypothetical protein
MSDHQESRVDASAPRARTLSRLSGNFAKWSQKTLKERIVLVSVLAIVLFAIEEYEKHLLIDLVLSYWRRQPTQIVLAVFPDTSTSRPMAEGLGFSDARTPIELKEGWRLEYMAEAGTAEATDLALRKKLEDPNIVAVVGHESSSTVKYLLDHVYRDTAIPLILPAVTNPDITTVLQKPPVHILRLPPTDDRQVLTLRHLLLHINPTPTSVTLMLDNSNATYSNYIATGIIGTGGEIPFVDSIGVGLGDRGFDPRFFLSANPDVLVFIGMEVQADIFLRRLKHDTDHPIAAREARAPILVFTDGVAGDLFDQAAKSLLGTKFKIYLTCPFQPGVPKGQTLDKFPTYKNYAFAARQIIENIITRMGDSRINRATVQARVAQMIADKSDSVDFGGLKVKFDEHGNNVQGAVHILELTRMGVVHSLLCPCSY